MGSTPEMIIVGVVVAAALAWAGRGFWHSLRKTGGCSTCGSSGECPLTKDPGALDQLIDAPTDCEKTTSLQNIPR